MEYNTDRAILEIIGNFFKDTRIEQNISQQELADATGLNRSTILQVESGLGGNLITIIQMLRGLKKTHLLDVFRLEKQVSPLQLAQIELKKRKRASKTNKKVQKPKSGW